MSVNLSVVCISFVYIYILVHVQGQSIHAMPIPLLCKFVVELPDVLTTKKPLPTNRLMYVPAIRCICTGRHAVLNVFAHLSNRSGCVFGYQYASMHG